MPHPFILYGDSPAFPSGLARILRDLATRLVAREEALNIRVATVGVSEPHGLDWASWPHFRFQPDWQTQGERQVGAAIRYLQDQGATERPIVLVVFDPSRAHALMTARDWAPEGQDPTIPAKTQMWLYAPIDGHPVGMAIGGPAGEMIRTANRVLAYGKYGAQVLAATRGETSQARLPHGMEPAAWAYDPAFHPTREGDEVRIPTADSHFWAWWGMLPTNAAVIGVVATNQPRKDFSLVFEAIRPLEDQLDRPVALWIHSDTFTKYWDFGELARIYGLQERGLTFVSVAETGDLPDQALAARYRASTITIAPGLGEGFGYPILESLLCGTPVVHPWYAGGVELIPENRWLVEPTILRAEGIYGIQRPVVETERVVGACLRAIQDAEIQPSRSALWSSWASAFSWEHVWPRWEGWIRQGIRDVETVERIEREREMGEKEQADATRRG